MKMSRHPSVKWAQRSDVLFITIELPDAKDVKLQLEPDGKFYFYATSGPENLPYELDLDLYDKVDVNESKANIGSRNIIYLVQKAESKWWSRLLKQEGKPPVFLKVDWEKWIDEDEQDEEGVGNMDLSDIDFSNLKLGGGGDEEVDGADDEDEDEGDDDSETEEEAEDAEAPVGSKPDSNEEEELASFKPELKT